MNHILDINIVSIHEYFVDIYFQKCSPEKCISTVSDRGFVSGHNQLISLRFPNFKTLTELFLFLHTVLYIHNIQQKRPNNFQLTIHSQH